MVDLIIEVRDARIPHSSACAHLNHVAQRKKRIIIFNKADLITARETRAWSEYWAKQGEEVIYTDALKGDSLAQLSPLALSKRGLLKITDRVLLFMIIGVPNTGKSTVINALRGRGRNRSNKRDKLRSNVASTGARPGVTRQVSTIQFSFNPPAYLVDTPGMLSPRLQNDLGGYKLALTGAVKDAVVDPVALADYLLYKLNLAEERAYVKLFGLPAPTDDILELLDAVARRVGIFRRTGRKDAGPGERKSGTAPDHFNAAMHLIQLYRKAALARFVLDDLPPPLPSPPPSRNALTPPRKPEAPA